MSSNQIYREKLFDAIVGNPAPTESQVWAHHILVDSEETALDIRNRLANGESFCDLAKEFSTDTSNKDNCGDLGWFSKGKMVQEFEQAAFALEAGQISQPVKTQFGWHIIQSLGKEDRTIPTSDYDQMRQDKFQEWLSAARTDAQVDIKEFWIDRLPEQPTLPQEILNYIQQALQQQPTPPPPCHQGTRRKANP